MKKLMIILFLCVAFTSNYSNNDFSLKNIFDGEYVAYSTEPISEVNIDLGNCYMNIGETRNKTNKNSIIGESIRVNNLEVATAIKVLDAEVRKTEVLSDGEIVIYAYSNKIPKSVKINGVHVNLQIAYCDEYCVIGWPLILGSF